MRAPLDLTQPMIEPERILDDRRSLLLAVCEHRCKSMNGASARRLAIALEDLSRGRLEPIDASWLTESLDHSADRHAFWSHQIAALDSDVTILPCWSEAYPPISQ